MGNEPYFEQQEQSAEAVNKFEDASRKLLQYLERYASSHFQECIIEILAEDRDGDRRRQEI